MSITSKSIAEALQLSPSTVSLALNGKPGVSEATRKRVLDFARENNYSTASNGNDQTILGTIRYVIYISSGFVVNEISFQSFTLKGIESQAKQYGYNVIVTYFYEDSSDSQQIEQLFSDVDGVILLGTEYTERCPLHEYLTEHHDHPPIVIIDNKTFHTFCDCISTNNIEGSYNAIKHLASYKHTNIGYFSSKERIQNFDERKYGIHKFVEAHPEVHVTEIPVHFSTNDAYQDICEYIENTPNLPTAFFSDSDIIAFGAIRAFNKYGLRIPEDVSLMGFDDMPTCELITPPLSTIRVPKVEMGEYAADILHRRILEEREGRFQNSDIPSVYQQISLSIKVKQRMSISVPRK